MEIIKFALVGLLGTFAQYLTLIIGVDIFFTSAIIASSIGFIIGAFINHHFNRKFTFKTEKTYAHTLAKFMTSAAFLFVVNFIVMFLLTRIFNIQYLISQIVATGAVFVMGFLINKFVVFKR